MTKTAKWSEIKPFLQEFDKPALLKVIQDLHKLNNDNKIFLASRLMEVDFEELSEPYRRKIRSVFNPPRGFPSFRLSDARKALNNFKKACADPVAVADLMIFYVEQGVICTNSYGDIDAPFYHSLESVYERAIQTITSTGDPEIVEQFRPRMQAIVQDTGNIGWGFHDELAAMYRNEYPAEYE